MYKKKRENKKTMTIFPTLCSIESFKSCFMKHFSEVLFVHLSQQVCLQPPALNKHVPMCVDRILQAEVNVTGQ